MLHIIYKLYIYKVYEGNGLYNVNQKSLFAMCDNGLLKTSYDIDNINIAEHVSSMCLIINRPNGPKIL